MAKKDIQEELALVDMSDEELKEALGHTYHSIKNAEENMRSDPDLLQMKEKVKLYEQDNYKDEIKSLKARLKAARALASTRGIHWTLPETK